MSKDLPYNRKNQKPILTDCGEDSSSIHIVWIDVSVFSHNEFVHL
jgi:hypothetical protein